MQPFKTNHYMVEHDVYPGIESGSLCGKEGWSRGVGLSETIPAPDRKVCQKCNNKLAELGEPNE